MNDWREEAVINDYARSLEDKVMQLEARNAEMDARWREDERLTLGVTWSDERPDENIWTEVVLMACVLICILVAIYQVANTLRLI